MKYFISDLHIGDTQLNNCLRQKTNEEVFNLLIENINNTVKDTDSLYILGDIFGEEVTNYVDFFQKINCKNIYIIAGNHDPLLSLSCLSCIRGVMTTFYYENILFTHYPVHEGELKFYKGNVHGHIHTAGVIHDKRYDPVNPGDTNNKYLNVNCEFLNYTPISLEEILNKFEND